MQFEQKTLDRVLAHIESFHSSTGFKLSYDKTTIYRIGSLQKSSAKLYTTENLNWTSESINVLGIDIYSSADELLDKNYASIIKKMEEVLNRWDTRSLCLVGKCMVVNTLISSLFVYKMTVLPKIKKKTLNYINTAIEQFIWNGHCPKIPTETLQSKKAEGGAGLTNLEVKDVSLKASWVQMLMTGVYPCEVANSFLVPEIGNMLWCCNLKKDDVCCTVPKKSDFWSDVLEAWCIYHYTSLEEIGSDQILWFNSDIRVGGMPVWLPDACKKGLMYVSQLGKDHRLKTVQEICEEFGLSVMKANSLISALPLKLRQLATEPGSVFRDDKYAAVMRASSAAKCVYDSVIPKPKRVGVAENRWECELKEDVLLAELLRNCFKSTVSAKHQSFQYRFLLKALVLNPQLRHWGKRESSDCTFCELHKETYRHIFWECDKVQCVWHKVVSLCKKLLGQDVNLTYANIVKSEVSENPKDAANLIVTVAKQYICRTATTCTREGPFFVPYLIIILAGNHMPFARTFSLATPLIRTRHYQKGINTGVNSNWHALARFHPAANRCKEHSSRVGHNYFIYLLFINLLKKPN